MDPNNYSIPIVEDDQGEGFKDIIEDLDTRGARRRDAKRRGMSWEDYQRAERGEIPFLGD